MPDALVNPTPLSSIGIEPTGIEPTGVEKNEGDAALLIVRSRSVPVGV